MVEATRKLFLSTVLDVTDLRTTREVEINDVIKIFVVLYCKQANKLTSSGYTSCDPTLLDGPLLYTYRDLSLLAPVVGHLNVLYCPCMLCTCTCTI